MSASDRRLATGAGRLRLYIVVGLVLFAVQLRRDQVDMILFPPELFFVAFAIRCLIFRALWDGSDIARVVSIALLVLEGGHAITLEIRAPGLGFGPLAFVAGLCDLVLAAELVLPTAVRAFVHQQSISRRPRAVVP